MEERPRKTSLENRQKRNVHGEARLDNEHLGSDFIGLQDKSSHGGVLGPLD